MAYKNQIYERLNENNGIVTSSWCVKEGIPRVYLSRMTKSGELHRVARGVYASEVDIYDSYFLLQNANPVCIFSYVSALDILEETDLIPDFMEVTVYSGYNASRLPGNIIVHYIQKALHEFGVRKEQTKFGNTVRTYDFERTICDLISNRAQVDPELFSKTMFRYARKEDKDIHKLINYAERMGIKRQVRDIFEVLLNG
ncbi:MAG: type IV toxin-antitoxin system AbiEi family antitoxin domain-containing protein [Chloroflexota bacterium]|nr:type IV toxin-antitoxin system AbiEi family antitoxin domain-containing protein [Chloroflexota bacterium]